jgi:catechol 2,3-dioxygenase-like lactoylglutathione lyase family enzyme
MEGFEFPQKEIQRLACIGLTTHDASALGRFYERVLDFRLLATHCDGPDWMQACGAADIACRIELGIGEEVIELRQFERPGRAYPLDASASDLRFQHFAIVVADMTAAYRRLCSADGWSAISTGGPQRLPPSSGGVEAFKFRDPEGHPLELLAFPDGNMPEHWKAYSKAGLFIGIDHSAISVSDTRRSIAFYQALGLGLASRSVNSGIEQARLDGLTEPQVEVTALAPPHATPHVELLAYRSDRPAERSDLGDNDVAATQLVFDTTRLSSANVTGAQRLVDPDGHRLVLIDRT